MHAKDARDASILLESCISCAIFVLWAGCANISKFIFRNRRPPGFKAAPSQSLVFQMGQKGLTARVATESDDRPLDTMAGEDSHSLLVPIDFGHSYGHGHRHGPGASESGHGPVMVKALRSRSRDIWKAAVVLHACRRHGIPFARAPDEGK
jgi:hypothetical protein